MNIDELRNAPTKHAMQVLFYGVVAIGLAIFFSGLIFGSWFTVTAGEAAIVTRFGSPVGIYKDGLHFKWPWAEDVQHFNLRAQSVAVEKAEGGTHDQQPVHVDLVVRYEVNQDQVLLIFSRLDQHGDMKRFVDTAMIETFKAVTARYTAPELLTQRSDVSAAVINLLQSKLVQFGVKVISVDMTSFAFQPSYMEAINAKVNAEQQVLTQAQLLAKTRIEQQTKVAVADAEAQATISRTNAAATAMRTTADAEAYQLSVAAQARGKAISVEAAALRDNAQLLDLKRVEVEQTKAARWNGQLPVNMYGSAPIPFLSVGR